MTQLVFDIYPSDYPVTSTRLYRVTNQEYQKDTFYLHGRPMGQGQLVVDKDQAFVTATNFAVGNYVIVRDLDLHPSSDTQNVVGGWYMEEGDFTLVSDDPKVLKFSGRSTISVLERAIMGPESLSPSEGPHSIENGYWRWGSDTYGGVMRRALFEANYQDPPGLPMISTLTVGADNIFWDDTNDSNGDPWPSFAGDFRTQCGTNLLELYRELYGYGVELEIDARTFDLYAFNPDGYGTDRTSATFAAGKVRFVAGVNIAADLTRSIHGRLRTTHLLVKTTDYPQGDWIEADDYTPGDPVYKRVYQTGDISGDPSTSAAIASRAQRAMDLRTHGEDGVRIPLSKPGDDEANGGYTPGPNFAVGPGVTSGHFWTGDLGTLDTGDHTMDYADASKRVDAIEYVLRVAGDWDVVVHTGARFWYQNTSLTSTAGATGHQLPIELCRPGTSTDPTLEATGELVTASAQDYVGLTVDDSDPAIYVVTHSNNFLAGSVAVAWLPEFVNAGDPGATAEPLTKIAEVEIQNDGVTNNLLALWRIVGPTASDAPGNGGLRLSNGALMGFWYYSGVNQSNPNGAVVTLPVASGSATSLTIPTETAAAYINAAGWAEFNAPAVTDPTAVTGQTQDFTSHVGASVGNYDYGLGGGHGDSIPGWDFTNTYAATSALGVAVHGTATSGDGAAEVVGTSARAARCDHNHYHNDLLSLDAAGGHAASAVTVIPFSTIEATNVQDALEEIASEAGVTDHGALTGLADDDHTQYLNAARHTATDHGDVTETAGYWSPLTNGDTATPELVFAAGDTIAVWTET